MSYFFGFKIIAFTNMVFNKFMLKVFLRFIFYTYTYVYYFKPVRKKNVTNLKVT